MWVKQFGVEINRIFLFFAADNSAGVFALRALHPYYDGKNDELCIVEK